MIFLIGVLAICDAAWAAERPELIDVGGFRLDVLRGGSGGPPIIFEAGLGSTLETWEKVWPAAAKLSTTVAYSRFGLGRSDAGSLACLSTARSSVPSREHDRSIDTRAGKRADESTGV
jgi:pimeloyl-ACP methyl ester carboxylesterase